MSMVIFIPNALNFGYDFVLLVHFLGHPVVPRIIRNDHPSSLDQIVRLLLHGLEKSKSSTVKTKIREEVEILLMIIDN